MCSGFEISQTKVILNKMSISVKSYSGTDLPWVQKSKITKTDIKKNSNTDTWVLKYLEQHILNKEKVLENF